MNTQTFEENQEFIQTMQSNLSKPQTSGANGYQRRYNSIDYSLDQKIDDFSYQGSNFNDTSLFQKTFSRGRNEYISQVN